MIRKADGKPHVCLGAEFAPEPELEEEQLAAPQVDRKEYQKIHDEVWAFARGEAAKLDLDALGKNIIAQVFYKKNMDMLIHSKQVKN